MKTTLLSLRSSNFIGRLRPFISRAAAFIARRATCLLLVRAGFKPALYRRGTPRLYCVLLLATACCLLPLTLAAQNGITISNFSMSAGVDNAPDTLTFHIEWEPRSDGEVWSDTVWVFVDYNNAGTMTRLPLLPSAATLTAHSAPGVGKVIPVDGNPNGVWVVGNARATQGAFTATVQLLLVETWRATSLHGLCIYAINYPPVGRYTAGDKIQFNGTPPFYLTYSGGGAATVTRDEAKQSVKLDNTLVSFTDASLAPGVTFCKVPNNPSLLASSTVYCSTGAGVTLALASPEAGATYLLYKGDSQLTTIAATGGAATFSGTYAEGSYTVRMKESAAFCVSTDSATISVNMHRPASTGSSQDPICGCSAGLVVCSGVCRTNQAKTGTWICGNCSSSEREIIDQCGNKTREYDNKVCRNPRTWNMTIPCSYAVEATGSSVSDCSLAGTWANGCYKVWNEYMQGGNICSLDLYCGGSYNVTSIKCCFTYL